MKKLISLMLALMMLALPALAAAETVPMVPLMDANAIPTVQEAYEQMAADALAAGRRIETDIRVSHVYAPAEGADPYEHGNGAYDRALKGLLESLSLTIGQQGDEGNFALKIGEKSVLDFALALSGEDLYLASNLLGGTVVLNDAEIEPLVGRLLDMFTVMGEMTQEEADEIKAQLPEIIRMVEAELNAGMDEMTLEELMALDYTAFVTAMGPILAKTTSAPVTGQTKNSDSAATLVTVTITPEDAKNLAKAVVQFLKDNPSLTEEYNAEMEAQSVFFYDEQPESFADLLDEVIADLDKATILTSDAVFHIYLDEAGLPVMLDTVLYMPAEQEEPVEEKRAVIVVKDEEGNVSLATVTPDPAVTPAPTPEPKETNVSINYVRLTTAEGVTHTVNVVTENGTMTIGALEVEGGIRMTLDGVLEETEETMHMALEIQYDLSHLMFAVEMEKDNETLNMTLAFDCALNDAEGAAKLRLESKIEKIGLTVHDSLIQADAKTVRTGVDFATDAVLEVFANGVKVFVAEVDTATTDPAASIMTGEVIRPAELNDTDFANWFVGVVNTLESWPVQLMMALPQDFLMMMYN